VGGSGHSSSLASRSAKAELCELTVRQILEWSGPLKVSYLARTIFRSWPGAPIQLARP